MGFSTFAMGKKSLVETENEASRTDRRCRMAGPPLNRGETVSFLARNNLRMSP
jgi:hypothetical protein